MNLQCLHLEPTRAFHFGQRGVGVEGSTDYAPSDTIFSALCSVLRTTVSAQALTEMLDRFAAKFPPFLVSCGFPYVMLGDRPLRFYPAPMVWKQIDSGDDRHKSRWISESIFLQLVNGGTPTDRKYISEIEALVTRAEYQALEEKYKQYIRANDGRLPLWTVDDVPRVAVDRITSASAVYRAGCLSFAAGGGIWVGIVPIDEEWTRNALPLLFDVLGEQGLGGERSSGYGSFRHNPFQDVLLRLPDVSDGDRFMTLSYFAPDVRLGERGVFSSDSVFGLDVRRGWMSSPDNSQLRRKSVRMVRFGSVLHAVRSTGIFGQIVDTAPDAFKLHPVWRYGFALPVPLRI